MLALMVAGCARNMPPSGSDLGKIARIGNYEERSAALRRFAENRLVERSQLRRELLAAGFKASTDEGCEYFRWHGNPWGGLFEEVMIVGLCGDKVITNSGAIAP
jgi:hypothetical protein